MNKRIYIIGILIILSIKSFGQLQLPIYNQYLFGSYFLINPAVAGIDNQWKVSLITRQQWTGIADAPQTSSLAGEGSLIAGLNMGGYVFSDKNGWTKQTGYHFAFSYVLPLANENTSLKRLAFGIAFSGADTFFDLLSIGGSGTTDPVYVSILQTGKDHYKGELNTNVGAFLMWKGFYAGIAGSHILSGAYDENNYQNTFFPRNYNMIIGNKTELTDTYFMEQSAMVRVIENYDNHLDLTSKFYYKPKLYRSEATYWAGLSYRLSWKTFPLSSVSFAGFIGGDYNNFYYGYSYELHIAKLQFHHGGSHQIMVGYTLSMKGDRQCGCTPFSLPVL